MAKRRAFTLVELLVVIGVIAVLIAMLLPALNKAQSSAMRTQCLSNMRQLAMAQQTYAAENRSALIIAGNGEGDLNGTWITDLERYAGGSKLVRRCPSDQSPYFGQVVKSEDGDKRRTTSYAINNYVSPTHGPGLGARTYRKISEIRKPSSVIQFAELVESSTRSTNFYPVGDHIHPASFFISALPSATLANICEQMPVGRHGGKRNDWSGILNYAFLDGHAESLPLKDVWASKKNNRFDPAVVK